MIDNPITSKWMWMANWCKSQHVSPYDSYWWNKAEEAYAESIQ